MNNEFVSTLIAISNMIYYSTSQLYVLKPNRVSVWFRHQDVNNNIYAEVQNYLRTNDWEVGSTKLENDASAFIHTFCKTIEGTEHAVEVYGEY